MKPLVFNSTPLIYLSKAGLCRIIENLKEEKLTSPLVKAEVVDKGKQKGAQTRLLWKSFLKTACLNSVALKTGCFLHGCLRLVGFIMRTLKF
ncbi:MAG: hypothetical protein PHY74_02165 [Candidatus Bathyarchaeota archaeon]|nr:hypothetical protein [Candidatus Bathyarchaeota archaeon]MDI9578697.1 hypothetical protein [Thermoproteota archaeon]